MNRMIVHRQKTKQIIITFKDCFGYQWNGLKELTGVGIRQQFLVGYRNRIRYINNTNLINQKYDPREVLLISTEE